MTKRRKKKWLKKLVIKGAVLGLLITSVAVATNHDLSKGLGEMVAKTIKLPANAAEQPRKQTDETELIRENNRRDYLQKLTAALSEQQSVLSKQKLWKSVNRIQIPETLLKSRNVVLMKADTGEIIFSKNPNEITYPASLTKMVTTLVAVDRIEDYDQKIIMDPDICSRMIIEDASVAGFMPGEEINLRDLVYGVMLPSGGDASAALAEMVAGTESQYVEWMNEKVANFGLKNTHFTNPVGLHNPENYSTAREMAEIVRMGLRDETFTKIFTKDYYITSKTEEHPDGIYLSYSVRNYMDALDPVGYECLGGKTGFTEEAGLCLASTAMVNGKQYILVTLGAEAVGVAHFEDADIIYTSLYQQTKD